MSGVVVSYDGRFRFDGLETELASVLQQGATSITFTGALTHSGGHPVLDIPDAAGGAEYVALAILDINNRLSEIVHLTDYAQGANTGSIIRGQEGTDDTDHAQGAKVVHPATVQDFLNVQEHETDPDAHRAAIEAMAKTTMESHLTEHEQNPNVDPHPVYVRRDDGQLDVVEVLDTLVIRPNAQLVVQGDLVIEGRLMLHGYELFIGPTKPADMPDNLIWIQSVS